MLQTIERIIAFVFLTFIFCVGGLLIYRGTLSESKFTVITGKVVEKKISYTVARSGRSYYLAFRLAEGGERIAINTVPQSEEKKDSSFYLVDTGKTYKFYLDPTVRSGAGVNRGIIRIDYNNKVVYKKSSTLNLYGGILLIVLSVAAIVFVLKYKRKPVTIVNEA